MSKQLSSTLVALLRFAKTDSANNSWTDVAKVLEPLFFADMPMQDVVQILVSAYEELLSEPRFESGRSGRSAHELLLAPIKGPYAVERFGIRSLDQKYSIEQFYDAFVAHIVSEFRLCRSDWCKGEIFGNAAA